MENSSVASASSEAGSTRSQEIEELERFIDSYVLEYQVQGILGDKPDEDVGNDDKEPQVIISEMHSLFSVLWLCASPVCLIGIYRISTEDFNRL